MVIPKLTPRGVGVYARAKPIRPHVLRAARCRWVALMVESVDGRVTPLSELRAQAKRARDGGAESIWLWALHGHAAANAGKESARRLTRHLADLDADGVILDIEASHKGKPLAAREMVTAALDDLTERTGLGVTSFPLRASHPTMPWAEMSAGWGSPQIYDTARDRGLARRAVSEWRENGRVVIPSIAAYDTRSAGDGAAQLRGDLERVCLDDDGVCDVPGLIIWSEPQLSLSEAIELGQFSERWWP